MITYTAIGKDPTRVCPYCGNEKLQLTPPGRIALHADEEFKMGYWCPVCDTAWVVTFQAKIKEIRIEEDG